MHHHAALVGPVIREQIAELHHDAELDADGRRDARGRLGIAAARQPIGWLLIEVGLRLALPRSSARYSLPRDTFAHRSRSA